jgi:hypothetical protein
MSQVYSETSFPERLFLLGAGPSLELVFPYREEMSSWGDWVVQRSDLVQPFLEFIEPKYTIRYWAKGRSFNKAYGVSLNTPRGKIKEGGSLGAFISQFQEFGGKELFLFGFDGDGSGYWRDQKKSNLEVRENHEKDCHNMNKIDWGSTKLYHIGKTNNKFAKQICINDMYTIIGLEHFVKYYTVPQFIG